MSGLARQVSVLASAVLLSVPMAAQTAPASQQRASYWVNAGLGAGLLMSDGQTGASGIASGSYQFKSTVIVLRAATVAALFGDGFYDFGVLFGRGHATRHGYTAGAVGLAVVDGVFGSGLFGASREAPAVLGVPLDLQVFWRPIQGLAVGLCAFADVNRDETFVGMALSLQVGKFPR